MILKRLNSHCLYYIVCGPVLPVVKKFMLKKGNIGPYATQYYIMDPSSYNRTSVLIC